MSLNTDIISYWKLDGNSNDAVGSSNGTDTAITYSVPNGKINEGAGYNGTTSKITGSIAQPTSAYTVSMWIKNGGVTVADTNYRLWDTQESSGAGEMTGITFAYNPNRDALGVKNIRVYHNNGAWANSDDLGTTIQDGNFHLVGVTWDGSNAAFYLDGAAVGGGAYSVAITNAGHFDIGHGRGTSTFWNGAIDEVGIWSRALSGSEMSQLYNSGSGLQYPFPLDENQGNFLIFM